MSPRSWICPKYFLHYSISENEGTRYRMPLKPEDSAITIDWRPSIRISSTGSRNEIRPLWNSKLHGREIAAIGQSDASIRPSPLVSSGNSPGFAPGSRYRYEENRVSLVDRTLSESLAGPAETRPSRRAFVNAQKVLASRSRCRRDRFANPVRHGSLTSYTGPAQSRAWSPPPRGENGNGHIFNSGAPKRTLFAEESFWWSRRTIRRNYFPLPSPALPPPPPLFCVAI